MDALEDTHLALQSYLATEAPSDLGLKYLWIYGALQALYLQQDSLLAIGEALGKGSSLKHFPDEVRKIRECRNNLVGHPLCRDNGPEETKGSSHFLVQRDLHSHFVRVGRYSPVLNSVEFLDFDLTQLIPAQEDCFARKLSDWLGEEAPC